MARFHRYLDSLRGYRKLRRRRRSVDTGPDASGDPPTITNVAPTEGSSLGGTALTITGTGYTEPGVGVHTVLIGGNPCTDVVVNSDTEITCTSPAGTPGATEDVQVTNNNGTDTLSSAYSYHPVPTLTDVSPAAGTPLGGTEITLTGTGFTANGASGTTVTIDGNACTSISVNSDTEIVCDTPAGTAGSTFDVVVSNSNGVATDTDAWSYHANPTLTGSAPGLGPSTGYTGAILSGTGFQNNDAGTPTITIDGNPCTSVVVNSDVLITCDIPAGTAGVTFDIVLTNANGTATLTNGWIYAAVPTITDVSPSAGPKDGGTEITITGTGFQNQNPGTNSVTIDGNACTSVVVDSDTQITCDTPAGTAGSTFDVVLSNDNGSDTLTNGWSYHAEPTVTVVNPGSGPEAGGTPITITGTGFQNNDPGTNTVTIGGTAATGVSVVSDTSITCTTPAGTEGDVDVVVSNDNGTGTLVDGFTYNPAGAVSLPALWLSVIRRRRYSEPGVFRKYRITGK